MLRARMTGAYPPLRVYGPPGIAARILAAVDSIDWDRIGDDGPELHLAEINTDRVHWSFSKVGKGVQGHAESVLEDGVLLRQPDYCVRCATLDHGIPVLAFSLELSPRYSICKQRLLASGYAPGPWLNELKHALRRGDLQAMIEVPAGATVSVAQLRRELVDSVPGEKLCYATDFADTEDNRKTVLQLARHADLFFCEASFTEEDLAQAQATSHLTTRACGEIAAAAGVKRLVPFHFSKRYNSEPQRVYEQIANSCGSVRIAHFAY
jgi:ribonuclease BN (tRNA processing enzyme)